MSVVFALIGVFLRPIPSIKVFAAFLIAALAVYANTWWTYLAAVFIIATTMTELAFLENLAAIIRGTPNFPYRPQPTKEAQATAKERLSPDEDEVEVGAEPPNEPIDDSPLANDVPTRESIDDALRSAAPRVDFYVLEQLGLSFLEKRLGESIQRNVSLVSGARRLTLDGVIQRMPPSPDALIDLKFFDPRSKPSLSFRLFVLRSARTLRDTLQTVEAGTGRRYTVILAVVVPNKRAVARMVPAVEGQLSQSDPTLRLEIIDFSDIGYQEPRRSGG